MIQNILRYASGIEVYGLFSILFFFACFMGALLWALRLKQPFLESMAALPLEAEKKEEQS
jgi:hypothetical protein